MTKCRGRLRLCEACPCLSGARVVQEMATGGVKIAQAREVGPGR